MGLRSRRAGGPGPLRPDRPAGRGRARPRRPRRLPPRAASCSEQPLVSIVIPTNGQVRDVRFEPVVLVVNCVRSIVERSTYENYEIVCVVDDGTDPAILQELRELAGERLRLVALRRALQLLGEDQPRRRAQRGRAPAAAQRRHRGGDAELDRADGDVLRARRGRRGRRPAALGATAASSTSASTSKAASPTTPTAASPATSTATPTRS